MVSLHYHYLERLAMLKNATYPYHHLFLTILPDLFLSKLRFDIYSGSTFCSSKGIYKIFNATSLFHNLYRMRENLYHTNGKYENTNANFE